MTTYTPAQISAARSTATRVATPGTTDWANRFVEALGLTVEDPKPEPGVYFRGAALVIVDRDGHSWDFSTGFMPMSAGDADPRDLTPARVVPAEPVELSKGEVGALYNAARLSDPDVIAPGMTPNWADFGEFTKDYITGALNAALAKYGGTR
jgi:hypothetical protein